MANLYRRQKLQTVRVPSCNVPPVLLYDFNRIWSSFGVPRQIPVPVTDIKFRAYPSSGARADT